MLTRALGWTAALSLTGGGLWGLTQAVRPWAERRCSARGLLRLQLLALAGFWVPAAPLLSAGAALFAVPAAPAPGTVAGPVSLRGLAVNLALAAPGTAPAWGRLAEALPLLWLGGLAAVLLHGAWRQHRFHRGLIRIRRPAADPALEAVLEELSGQMGPLPQVRFYTLDGPVSPFGRGLLRPEVYLPGAALSNRELRMVLRHELTHVRRGDLFLKWAAWAVCAVHWFNPLVWLCRKALGQLVELACDEAATQGMTDGERRDYGAALLAVLRRCAAPAGGLHTAFCSGSDGLKQRLRRLTPRPPTGGRAAPVLAGLLLLAAVPLSHAAHAFAAPSAQGGLGDYRAAAAAHNARYQPLGVTYDAVENAFYYQGERLTMFLDERPMSREERARYPWCTASLDCAFRDPDWTEGPALRTVRNGDGALTGVESVPPELLEELKTLQSRPVTYHSSYIYRDELYASDPPLSNLPDAVWTRALSLGPGQAAFLRDGGTVYLCCGGGEYPWKLQFGEDGALEAQLYSLRGAAQDRPTVIRCAVSRPVEAARIYLDGEIVPMEGIE